jgi:hypothetical protein
MDPDPDQNLDLAPFFSDFKDDKKIHIFSYTVTYPKAHYLQSQKFNFLRKFKNFILQSLFQSAQHIY